MAAVWTQDWDDATVVAVTSDGGKTWAEHTVDGQVPGCQGDSSTNPRVTIGADRTIYVSSNTTINENPLLTYTVTNVNASRDGGRTWVHDERRETENGWPWVTADPKAAGTAYALADRFGDPSFDVVARTTDGGTTWSDPQPVTVPDAGRANVFGHLFVLGDGSLLDVFEACDNNLGCRGGDAVAKAVRSTDRGASWSAVPADGVAIPDGWMDVAVDKHGVIVIAFAAADGAGWDIRTSRSADRGTTWAPPSTAVQTTQRPTQIAIAVAGDGTVGLSYAEHGPPGLGGSMPYQVSFAWSRDGAPWQHRLLAGPTDAASMPATNVHSGDAQALAIGEWQGLAGLPHGFAAAFPLGRPQATIGPSDVFFDRWAMP
jgi:hypothetical protein